MAEQSQHVALDGVKLYVLLTKSLTTEPLEEVACAVLEAGAHAIQIREKRRSDEKLLSQARRLKRLTDQFGALLIVNDRPDIAILSEADGIHLGQDDLPVTEVRKIVGPNILIGLSTHNGDQVRSAALLGADYIGIGPAFATTTKGYDVGIGLAQLAELATLSPLPTVAIGGIKLENVRDVLKAGVQAIAVCSAIISTRDPHMATKRFLSAIREVEESKKT